MLEEQPGRVGGEIPGPHGPLADPPEAEYLVGGSRITKLGRDRHDVAHGEPGFVSKPHELPSDARVANYPVGDEPGVSARHGQIRVVDHQRVPVRLGEHRAAARPQHPPDLA